MVTLNDGFRQGWQRVFSPDANKDHEFSELLNLLEIACGIHKEKSLVGVSRELSREYIEHVILLPEGNEDARRRMEAAIHTPTTFKYISWFRTDMRGRNPTLGLLNYRANTIQKRPTSEAPGPVSHDQENHR
jgi:hypothetical protein